MRDRGRKRVPILRLPEHGGGRLNVPTSPADIGIDAWPQCAECSIRQGRPVPVEGYSVDREKPSMLSVRIRLVVRAECSHGRGMDRQSTRVQSAAVDVPYFWGTAQEVLAVRKLVFFAPGESPENRMLV